MFPFTQSKRYNLKQLNKKEIYTIQMYQLYLVKNTQQYRSSQQAMLNNEEQVLKTIAH